MTDVIVCGNQKGGSGKTTTAANLIAALRELGQSVLAVDLDPQAQLATVLQVADDLPRDEDGNITVPTITSVLNVVSPSPVLLKDAIIETPYPGVWLLPGSPDLSSRISDIEKNAAKGLRSIRALFNDEALAAQGLDFDYIVIDTAPRLDSLLDAALIGADFVLPVLAPEGMQMEAMSPFVGRVGEARSWNPDLRLLPALVNKAKVEWAASGRVMDILASVDIEVFPDVIPMYAKIEQTYLRGPVLFAAPDSREAGIVRAAMRQVIEAIVPAEVS